MGPDFLVAIHNFFYGGRLLKEVNHTLVALIPKMANASKITDFRPISCCTTIYKCISKVVVNRIKPHLDDLISQNQSAFIPGRRITDNILMAHELVSGYHINSGPPRCAFKVGIRKAYDSIDLTYLITML